MALALNPKLAPAHTLYARVEFSAKAHTTSPRFTTGCDRNTLQVPESAGFVALRAAVAMLTNHPFWCALSSETETRPSESRCYA
jgi:hypothetical protein